MNLIPRYYWPANVIVALVMVVLAGLLTGCASTPPAIDIHTVEVVKPVPVPCLTAEHLAAISSKRPAPLGQTPYPQSGVEREAKLAAYAASQRYYLELIEAALPSCAPPRQSGLTIKGDSASPP